MTKETDPIKVLLVDDHAVMRMGLAALLGTQKQIEIVGDTGDGASAIRKAQKLQPDVVILDLMMPGIDGFEVIRRLRADDATKDLPIIILSALNSEQDISKGFQLGANDFINKPIIMEKLLSSVTTQINLQAAKQAAG